MDLINEIRTLFWKGNFGYALPVASLPSEYPAWVVKDTESVSVAVPLDKMIVFSETFSSISIATKEFVKIDRNNRDLLILTSTDMENRDEFASFCADFVDPGENGERRTALTMNPSKWWEKWKRLVGNTSIDVKPYDVLAELLVLERLFQAGKDPKWTGKTYGTNDIETTVSNYEVKSTLSRYGNDISISSLHQLVVREPKDLHLIFVRFEESESGGESIEKAVKRLKNAGFDAPFLESALKKHGLEMGRTGRTKQYNVLEMRDYVVDEQFPAVTPHSFKNEQIPEHVKRFTYTITLEGLRFESFA